MCLVLFAYDWHPDYYLVLAANRDEFYGRPTQSADFWKNKPQILAGRDLLGNGTWLGVTTSGKISCVTNFRSLSTLISNAPSRGRLVSEFLEGIKTPHNYINNVRINGDKYNGFNLITGDSSGLYYYSNLGTNHIKLKSGIYGLCNHFLDTPWPKTKKGKKAFTKLIEKQERIDPEEIFQLLGDQSKPHDNLLPDTGVGFEWERILSSIFIKTEGYGTCSSTVIFMKRNGDVTFLERTYTPPATSDTKERTVTFNFQT